MYSGFEFTLNGLFWDESVCVLNDIEVTSRIYCVCCFIVFNVTLTSRISSYCKYV